MTAMTLIRRVISPERRHQIKRQVQRLVARPPIGSVSFGDLARVKPISEDFGFDRGLPVDRFYIEKFLRANQNDIGGHVLEIANPGYTRKFGGKRVTKSEVLHRLPGNPEATIVADLTNAPELGSDRFDCVILTQTLNFIYDFRAALATVHRLVKPGGVVLLTVAGISQVSVHDVEQWGDYWRFTSDSFDRICREAGPWQSLDLQSYGNVLSSAAFLYGVASEEISAEDLEHFDPTYQLIISARLVK